jgi:cathepsin L
MIRGAAIATLLPAAFSNTTWQDLQANSQYNFADYVAEFEKSYSASEYLVHEALFTKALVNIRKHNADPNSPWKMGLNELTDATDAEMQNMKGKHRGLRLQSPPQLQATAFVNVTALPTSVDWRDHGVVTKVKNQGGCGSCWAFASTETVESAVAIATGGQPPVLSPQELVSCAPNPDPCGGTGGCQGSTEPLAFKYVQEVGMTTEAIYPYEGRTGTCDKSKVSQAKVHISGYTQLPTNQYGPLMQAVATKGPIAISVDASWGGYETGVYTGACGTTIDHAVQLVGYGTDSNSGHDYWLVRNSWGASWGEKGYIRIQRFGDGKEPCGTDKNPLDGNGCKGGPATIQVCGLCGILSDSSYVTAEKPSYVGIQV